MEANTKAAPASEPVEWEEHPEPDQVVWSATIRGSKVYLYEDGVIEVPRPTYAATSDLRAIADACDAKLAEVAQ